MRRTAQRILTTIQLTRLTLAFGAVSDVWLVILLTRARVAPTEVSVASMPLWMALALGAALAVSLFAYGASLNDVLDARHDSAFSPQRPIPAGDIGAGQAIIVTVGALLVAIVAGQGMGPRSLHLTLLTAIGILFYNAAGRFIPAMGLVIIGLLHALHMLIPNVMIEFTWPVWCIMSHVMLVNVGVHILEDKRPRLTRRSILFMTVGWVFWSAAIIGWGVMRGGVWPADASVLGLAWPLLAVAGFAMVARWKTRSPSGVVAAEKLQRYGAMWQCVYASAWLAAIGHHKEALGMGLFAVAGLGAMTLAKEMLGKGRRPIAYRA